MEAKVSPDTAKAKAELLAGGAIRIPEHFRLPFSPSRSTAGPGAGLAEIVLSFGGTRAKKAISRTEGEFELTHGTRGFGVARGTEVIVDGVDLVPTLFHAPFQAFINVDCSCSLNCAFCNSHRLERNVTKNLTDDKILTMVIEAASTEGFQGVALTSGVPTSQEETTDRIVGLISRIRAALPEAPIGVEPYVTHPRQIDAMKAAGATEIKINIESFDPEIFDKVCPSRDYGAILHAINHAGGVFGRNRVCSNIIFGLGETDDNVLDGAKVLANMGAVATLRGLRVSNDNSSALEAALGTLTPVTPERMLALARSQKKILGQYGLTPLMFKTMCHACLSCDIVPFWDV
ncbi:MAG: radical SAM protein [Thermoplasmata archaeon]|nr:radical SAM protein [Thermoplasmata archaeon]